MEKCNMINHLVPYSKDSSIEDIKEINKQRIRYFLQVSKDFSIFCDLLIGEEVLASLQCKLYYDKRINDKNYNFENFNGFHLVIKVRKSEMKKIISSNPDRYLYFDGIRIVGRNVIKRIKYRNARHGIIVGDFLLYEQPVDEIINTKKKLLYI